MQINPLYTQDNSDYLKNKPTWHVEDSYWKSIKIKNILLKNKINPSSIVEIGCGAGEILKQLQIQLPDEIEFFGYNISPDAINLAKTRENNKLSFYLDDLTKIDKHFDVLLMIDVFEHVEDYMGFLRVCKSKSEYSVFHIPLDLSVSKLMRNKLSEARKHSGHLHYFNKETALATLTDLGYQILDYDFTLGFIELKKSTFRKKAIQFFLKFFYKINKKLAISIFGGASLIVLTKNN